MLQWKLKSGFVSEIFRVVFSYPHPFYGCLPLIPYFIITSNTANRKSRDEQTDVQVVFVLCAVMLTPPLLATERLEPWLELVLQFTGYIDGFVIRHTISLCHIILFALLVAFFLHYGM
jgi:hypothetical protein